MNTLQELIKYEKELSAMFDSDIRIALALLEEIRKIKNQNK